MKRILRIPMLLAVLLALALLSGCSVTPDDVLDVIAPTESPAPGADLTFSGVVEQEAEPLYMTYTDLDGTFCPFWAEKDGDRTVVSLTQLSLMTRDGRPAPAEITRLNNEDGSTSILIRLRSDLVCSDGTPLDADDLLFSLYVLLDTDYEGPYQLKTLPIRGLSSYWNGIDADMYSKYVFLYDDTYRNGTYDKDFKDALDKAANELKQQGVPEDRWMNNTAYREAYQDLQSYDTERAEEIRTAVEAAWKQDSYALVDYIISTYSSTITLGTKYTIDEIREFEGLQVMCAMRERLFGSLNDDGSFTSSSGKTWDLLTDFPTIDDFYEETYAAYKGDAEQYWLIEGVGRPNMLETVENELVLKWASEDPEWRGPVNAISGIEKLDDLTVSVTFDYCDDIVAYTLTDIYIAPLHVYGDTESFDIEKESFGFTKGDLMNVMLNAKISIGAGEYVYRLTDIRTVYLDASESFYLGKNETPEIILSKG